MALSNEIMAKDTAEHTRKWWGIQKGFKSLKHMCSCWWKRVTVRHFRHWNLEYQRLSATLLDGSCSIICKLGKERIIPDIYEEGFKVYESTQQLKFSQENERNQNERGGRKGKLFCFRKPKSLLFFLFLIRK